MTHNTAILFTSPKRGGILQSSGYLDLKSLISLSRTAKANAIDEQSLIMLIEHELTRDHHHVRTVEEAIAVWKDVYLNPVLKEWVERERRTIPTREMISEAVRYDAMLTKMVQMTPGSERIHIATSKDNEGWTLLHRASLAGNVESLKALRSLCTEASYLETVVLRENFSGATVLHLAVRSGNPEMIIYIVASLPVSQLCRLVNMQDFSGKTALHRIAECSVTGTTMKLIFSLLTETQRLQLFNVRDARGRTLLHCAYRNPQTIKDILNTLPKSQRMRVVCLQDRDGWTVFHHAFDHTDAATAILDSLPQSQRWQVVNRPKGKIVLYLAILNLLPKSTSKRRYKSATDVELPEAKRQRL